MSTDETTSYYDVIGTLSSFECSQEVTFNQEELTELTKESTEDKPQDKSNNERIKVHSYLGGKIDTKEASQANYDLGHTLLGGYVPQHQLECLSSIDFAHYFNRTLDCEDALKIYETFLPAGSRQCMLLSTQHDIEAKVKAKAQAKLEKKQRASGADPNGNQDERVLPDGKIVRKVIVCRRCNRKFRGSDRMKQLKRHECTK